MKRIVFLLLCVLLMTGQAAWGKIYRNNTKNPTAADSIVMEAALTSSAVVNQRIATNDYFLVTVTYPNGDSAWSAKIDSSDARVRETVRSSGSITNYEYALAFQVSNIDGDGREGAYKWEVVAVDSSSGSHSKYFGTMPVYNLNFYRMMDSVTQYLTEEYTNIIASDRGKVLVPTERTDGAYPTNAGRWKMKTGAGFGSGDSVNTNSSLDTDLDGDVDGGPRLIIDGDSTICIWVGANSTTHDTTTARCLIDTSTIDPRFFSNITFWAYVDMDHPHEGHCPGNAYSNSATDGDTPLKFIRVFLSSDTALATYYYKDFADTAVVRGWNKFVIAKSDFSKVGTIVWPVSDSSKPLLTVGFMVATDSVAGSSGMRDIRLMIDDVRINKRARPKFMFRLDDGHLSQYTHAYHVFQDFPFKPTTNVCGRAIELGNTSGNLNTSDLAILYEDGWDIANHAWYSAESQISGSPIIDSLAMAGTSLMNDRFIVNRNQSYILDLGFKRGAGFFAWPLDAYDSTAIQVMAERHNFATGGKLGGYADHADEIPEKAVGYRYTYPYNPWTSNSPEIDIDTVKAWISHAIERGVPLILGAHSFKGHHSFAPTGTVSHHSGTEMEGVGGIYANNAPAFVMDGATPDDADYLHYTNAAGAGAGDYTVCSLNTSSSWYVTKASDNNWVDTVTFTWRVRGSATTDDDTLYLVLDTASTETLVNADTIIGIPTEWTDYSITVRRLSEGKVSGNDVNAGIRLKNTLGDANDTVLWSWLYVQAGDDSGTTTGYGTQMDTSYLRSICNELVAKQGLIDCVTLSEYFRTQGSGGRLATVLRQSKETLDSTVSIATQIAEVVTINDTVQAILDTLQAYYSSGRLTAATIDSILNALDASLSSSVLRQNEFTGFSTLTAANIHSQVSAVMDSLKLDHLLLTKPGAGVAPTDSTFLALLASSSSSGAWSGFNNTTDALQALRDRGDVAWITATGFSTLTAANVHTQVSGVMDSLKLDHLLLTKPGVSVAPTDSTFFALLATKSTSGAWSNYSNITDALEAIRDRGDAAWVTATGFSTLTAAQVHAQVGGVMDSLKLDHLLLTKPGNSVAPGDSTFFSLLVSSSAAGAWSAYVNTTDALQALRDRGDAAWITATGFSTFNPSTTPVEILATGGSAGKNAAELVDDIWDEDTTGHKTDPNMGYWITQGGGGGLSDAELRDALGDSLKDVKRVIAWAKGSVTGATPGDSGFSSSALTQVNDYWNDNQVLFVTGSAAGQVFRVVDFVAATDSLLLTPAWPAAAKPAQTDSFVIIGLLGATGSSGGSSGWTAAEIDSILNAIDASNADPLARVSDVTSATFTGPILCSLYVMCAGVPVDGINLRILATDGSLIGSTPNTDLNGMVAFSMAATDTFLALAYTNGCNQDTAPQTFITPGSGRIRDTITMTAISWALADSLGLCRVYGYVGTGFGAIWTDGKMCFRPIEEGLARTGNRLLIPTERCVPIDTLGRFEVYIERDVIYSETGVDTTNTWSYSVKMKVLDSKTNAWKEYEFPRPFVPPDSASYQLNLELGKPEE